MYTQYEATQATAYAICAKWIYCHNWIETMQISNIYMEKYVIKHIEQVHCQKENIPCD